jgi:uncharacterized protein YuzE
MTPLKINHPLKIGDFEFDHASYDKDADVLYLSVGLPRPGTGVETPEGHLARYDDDGQLIGLTIIGARELLATEHRVDITLPSRTELRSEDLEPALLA